jgi:uncharacterized integral membrane protein
MSEQQPRGRRDREDAGDAHRADRRSTEPGAKEVTGDDDEGRGEASARPPTPVTQQIGRVVVLLLVVLFGVFAATNAHRGDFSWVFGTAEVTETAAGDERGGVPLILLLLVSFAVGAVAGAGLVWQSGRARRRAGADDARDGR